MIVPYNIVAHGGCSFIMFISLCSKALAAFRNGDAQVLVASDAMTRGMDVEGVLNVVNYDVPVYAKTYVHRVGRTARAGRPGCAYTLMRKEEVSFMRA